MPMIGERFIKWVDIDGVVFGSGVKDALVLGGPDPIRNVFVIVKVSDND